VEGLAAEITPAAQEMLDRLIAEMEPLRQRAVLAEEREQQLRQDLAHHDFLPVPGRREFLRELNHVLNHLRDLTEMPSLALLHVTNADTLRRRHGREALDRLLTHVSTTVGACLGPNEALGNIGGNDFALILLGSDENTARERVADIRRRLSEAPLELGADRIAADVSVGIGELRKGSTAEAALHAADVDLVRR